jgi:hypothetical protein
MGVRRGAARLAAVLTVLGGLLAFVAAPAAADDDDKVSVRLPSSFAAGGSAGSVTLAVTKRSKGCVSITTGLRMRMAGLSPDQVQVQVAMRGQWQGLALSGGEGGLVVAGPTAPEKPELCERKGISVRYRVTLLPQVPAGTLTVVGEANAAGGPAIERGTDTARVIASKLSASASKTPTPAPTVEETVAAAPPVTPAATPTVVAGSAASDQGGGGFGAGSAAMLVGVGMVGIGIALLVVLLRRGRGGRDKSPAGTGPNDPGPRAYPTATYGGIDQTMAMPRAAGADATVYLPPGGADATRPMPGGVRAPGSDATVFLPPAGGAGGTRPPKGGGDATVIMPRLPR